MTEAQLDGKYLSDPMEVRPEWIDHNGHMNMAYYGVLFDKGSSHVYRRIGFGNEYRRAHRHTTFSGEFRVRYLRELKLGDRVRCAFQMLDVGPKSFHYVQELIHSDGWVAATGEELSLHIDQTGPRVAPYPPQIMSALEAIMAEQAHLPRPEFIGQKMGLRK
ncbi:thioesterase family protein [Pseudooceanicola nanhaiensis]|jgi:acyl-CoA thioester hydrolase|uniref:Thioesterase n=1 Tax=Pseudooceanicola nanhaiensis TaxID=375761 RepID=A0A917SML3_9RHOB|nr:thioesterase family protein [Pseudooceanicola nanhaiensis]GGL87215.1 thioesterase [Pseudooceanicola nanhaiensis]